MTLAGRVARTVGTAFGLSVLAPPAELGIDGFDMAMAWHERQHGDPAHTWMRGLVST